MITTPEIVESPAQKIAFIHVTVPRAEIMQAMQAGLAELGNVLKTQGVAPTGPWFTYHFRRPAETFDYRICFPIDKDIKPEGRVEQGELSAAGVVRAVYSGNYTGLGAAWGELMSWIDANDLNSREDLWERYLVGPDSSAHPEEWRTELNRPLA
ncbi:GyrI-like domain-containing protein [Edaphobacter flagellatus]|uniref:GyrI-like domain-containing protein n=1 Tax=Edaphobacter flagellatus TaxID=1933044 RepID=UPI0021B3321E|nr:GyrI-like domain-containing protein [Edaphobacter flagellatus]